MSVRKTLIPFLAGNLALATLAVPTAQAAPIDRKFNDAVSRMLMNMKDGPVAEMSKAERKELVACVQGVFSRIPEEKKKYIAEAQSESEIRARFDAVGLENRAALKQQVRDECA